MLRVLGPCLGMTGEAFVGLMLGWSRFYREGTRFLDQVSDPVAVTLRQFYLQLHVKKRQLSLAEG